MSDQKPGTLSSETIYRGRIFDLRIDNIRDGEVEYKREIIAHGGSSVIVPLFDDGTTALVRQYRHAAGRYLLELPAGTLESDEAPLIGALRELEEEIGVRAANIDLIAEFYVSPGFLTEKMSVYLATGFTEVGQKLEADEFLTILRHPIKDLLEMIDRREILDAKTIIGLQATAKRLGL